MMTVVAGIRPAITSLVASLEATRGGGRGVEAMALSEPHAVLLGLLILSLGSAVIWLVVLRRRAVIRGREAAAVVVQLQAAERELAEAARQYQATIQHAPVGVYRSSRDGRFQAVNPAHGRVARLRLGGRSLRA